MCMLEIMFDAVSDSTLYIHIDRFILHRTENYTGNA